MQKVILLCGVPGSGKTWVAKQLEDKYNYVPNDEFIDANHFGHIVDACRNSQKPVLADCPFAERALRDRLEAKGIAVTPVFIVERAQVVKKRYEAREKKPFPKQFLTRAINIEDRVHEWHCFGGTSDEVLKHLREL